ncbi:Baseplate J-like protein [compost metagenome]
MALQIKTFREILKGMASWIMFNNSKITNFRVGSAVRTILEAVSIELEALYFKMRKAFDYAVENSIANSFNFYPMAAIPSAGEITLEFKSYLTQRVILPKGFKFSTVPTGGKIVYFETIEETLCEEGTLSAVLKVQCTEPGTVGNVPANSIRISVTPLPYMSRVYNPEGFLNGSEQETMEEYKKRFNQYIETLARGTISSIQYGCLKVPGVSGAYVSDQIGEIKVYVHDSLGNLSEDLKAKVLEELINYRPAGTGVIVFPVNKRPVNVNITITLKSGFDPEKYKTIVQDSVITFLNNFVVSKGLTRAELITFIMNIDRNALVNVVLSMVSDIHVDNFELVRAGNITVTVSN